MREELKPCPFCGGEASSDGRIKYSKPLADTNWLDGSEVSEAFYVNCMTCGAVSRSGIVGGYQSKGEAIAAWNTRATEARIEALEAQVRGMVAALLEMAPHVGKVAAAADINHEMGRVVSGQANAALELSRIHAAALSATEGDA